MTPKIVAGNWKMNKTIAEAKAFFEELSGLIVNESKHQVMICAPFTTLAAAVSASKKLKFVPGAQNMHPAPNGTYTGEISANMLVEAGAKVVLTGHSERRSIFGESDAFINEKTKAGLNAGLKVILCVGDTLEQREKGQVTKVIKKQLTAGLEGITDCKNLIVAYEPVWAISGGDPNKPKPIATREQIEEAHGLIKSILAKQFGTAFIPVLYGGSANDKNCKEIFEMKDVDGALIGGASLVPAKFAAMINVK